MIPPRLRRLRGLVQPVGLASFELESMASRELDLLHGIRWVVGLCISLYVFCMSALNWSDAMASLLIIIFYCIFSLFASRGVVFIGLLKSSMALGLTFLFSLSLALA